MQEISESLTPQIRKLENQTIKKIANLVSKGVSPEYELELLYRLGYDLDQIDKELNKQIDHITTEMKLTIEQGIQDAYDMDVNLYKRGGKILKNPQAIKMAETLAERSLNEFINLTRTSGMVFNNKFVSMDNYLYTVLDNSFLKVASGLFDYNDAIEAAVRELGNEGIRYMHYSSGRRISIESAVRSNLLTTLSQVTGKMSEMNADEMDQDLMQISSHQGARPSHQVWQGDIVSRSGKRGYLDLSDIGYGDSAGFKGANCRHDWYPYFEGISVPFEKTIEPDGIEWEGQELSFYECTQKQRSYERNMRKTIRKINAFEGAKDDKNLAIENIRFRDQYNKYKAFSNKAKLPLQTERLIV